jgi:hypothetical protein
MPQSGRISSFQQPPTSFVCQNCGAHYNHPKHLDAHERERCSSSKRGLSKLLGRAKEVWEARKRRRLEQRQATASEPRESASGSLEHQGAGLQDLPPHAETVVNEVQVR